MPRKPFINSSENPYHITARTINKTWFEIPLNEIWSIMSDYLYLIEFSFNVKIYSFVLMNNHFHLLIKAPEGNISEAMNYFMRETSRIISRLAGRINQTYGSRFHRTLISNDFYFMHAYKYVYRNPITANICEQAESYPYSTLHGLLGFTKLSIPLNEDYILFPHVEETLNWLNHAPTEESYQSVKKALRRTEFKLPRQEKGKKQNPLVKYMF